MTMRIGILGCGGRMGRMLVRTVLETDGCVLASGSEAAGSPFLGQDVASLAGAEPVGIAVTASATAACAAAEAVIDFTVPAASAHHAAVAAERGVAFVVGTTGLAPEHQAAVAAAAARIAVVQAANFSVGVNLALGLTRRTASVLGPDYDIEILEMHHRHKVDAPSGTALALGHAAAEGRRVALADVARRVRDGHTGPRPAGEIGFAVMRGGDVVGDHMVLFAADGERIEIGHRASSRAVFARGAVRAALWTRGRRPGLYSMQDVLGLA